MLGLKSVCPFLWVCGVIFVVVINKTIPSILVVHCSCV